MLGTSNRQQRRNFATTVSSRQLSRRESPLTKIGPARTVLESMPRVTALSEVVQLPDILTYGAQRPTLLHKITRPPTPPIFDNGHLR
jgi:hypothetical protein